MKIDEKKKFLKTEIKKRSSNSQADILKESTFNSSTSLLNLLLMSQEGH